MEKQNRTQQKYAFTKTNVLQHKINTKKLKPGLSASYDIWPGNGEGLFLFRRFINLSLTNVLKTLSHLCYYSLGTHTVGVSQNWHKGSNVPSIRSPVVAKERTRPAGDFQCLKSVLWVSFSAKKWPSDTNGIQSQKPAPTVSKGSAALQAEEKSQWRKCLTLVHLKNGLAAHRLQKNL